MAATATIPKTVTVPGQLVYDAIVRLSAVETGLLRLNNATSPLQEDLLHTYVHLHEGAFGAYLDNDGELTPLAHQIEEEGMAAAHRLPRPGEGHSVLGRQAPGGPVRGNAGTPWKARRTLMQAVEVSSRRKRSRPTPIVRVSQEPPPISRSLAGGQPRGLGDGSLLVLQRLGRRINGRKTRHT
jgi:hypothetical protein